MLFSKINIKRKIIRLINESEKLVSPKKIAARHFKEVINREPELGFLDSLCPKGTVAIDIGVLWGAVTYKLKDIASTVYAFEANPDQIKFLRKCKYSNVFIIHAALSNRNGVAHLRVPLDTIGHGTIEEKNTLYDRKIINYKVPKKTLDFYKISKVGFIKIDVEGHELSVLKGAEQTLRASKPNMIVEYNEKHSNENSYNLLSYLKTLGYKSYVYIDSQIVELQNQFQMNKRVSDNIIFIHKNEKPEIKIVKK